MNLSFKPKTTGEYGRSLYGYERIYIDHKTGKFKSSSGPDSQFMSTACTGSKLIDVYALGLIRTRQMWPKMDDNDTSADQEKISSGGKLCISLDGDTGYPLRNFPRREFEDNGFSYINDDRTKISCESCPYSKWSQDGKHGPQCQPHWYIPMFSGDAVGKLELSEPPVILDITQSGITTFKKFYTSRARNSEMFVSPLSIELDMVQRNNRRFTRPEFRDYSAHSIEMTLIRRSMLSYWLKKARNNLTENSHPDRYSGSAGSGLVALKPTGSN